MIEQYKAKVEQFSYKPSPYEVREIRAYLEMCRYADRRQSFFTRLIKLIFSGFSESNGVKSDR